MKIYWNSKQIPTLTHLPLNERIDALRKAEAKLAAPEKLLLNVLKLCILVPVFVFILQASHDWMALVWALLFILTYPVLLRPLQYSFCVKHLPQANSIHSTYSE